MSCFGITDWNSNSNFLSKVNTDGELWWLLLWPRNPKPMEGAIVLSSKKVVKPNIADFLPMGIVHWEFVLPDKTVYQNFLMKAIRRLRNNVQKKDPICGKQETSFCTLKYTCTHSSLFSSLWLKMVWCFPQLTWHCLTFSYFHAWRRTRKDFHLTILKRSKNKGGIVMESIFSFVEKIFFLDILSFYGLNRNRKSRTGK